MAHITSAHVGVRSIDAVPGRPEQFRVVARTVDTPRGPATLLVGVNDDDVSDPVRILSRVLAGAVPLVVASLAALTGQKLPNQAAPDSVDVLPALLGKTKEGREVLVEQGRNIAVRKKNWKYIEPAKQNAGGAAKAQLYDLGEDLAEQRNLAGQKPEKVKELSKLLDVIRKSGRMP